MAEFKDDTLYGSSDTHMYMMEWEKHYMETCINLLELIYSVFEWQLTETAMRLYLYDV